jgi:hypothetical protein
MDSAVPLASMAWQRVSHSGMSRPECYRVLQNTGRGDGLLICAPYSREPAINFAGNERGQPGCRKRYSSGEQPPITIGDSIFMVLAAARAGGMTATA